MLLLLLLPIIYLIIICLMVQTRIKHIIKDNITSCTYPLYYPFKIKYLTRNYFLEENKGTILFHPEPLESLPSCKELEERLNEDDIMKLDYARHNMMSDMLAHNYLTFIKSKDAPFY